MGLLLLISLVGPVKAAAKVCPDQKPPQRGVTIVRDATGVQETIAFTVPKEKKPAPKAISGNERSMSDE